MISFITVGLVALGAFWLGRTNTPTRAALKLMGAALGMLLLAVVVGMRSCGCSVLPIAMTHPDSRFGILMAAGFGLACAAQAVRAVLRSNSK